MVEAYQGQVLEPGEYEVPVNGRYWTGFTRTDLLDGQARDMAWSGTAHALVAELGVGAATHSTLQLALGVAALLAGLGVVCMVMGGAFIWHVRSTSRKDDGSDTTGRSAGHGDRRRLTTTEHSDTPLCRAGLSSEGPALRRLRGASKLSHGRGELSCRASRTPKVSPTRYFWLRLAALAAGLGASSLAYPVS